MNVNYDERAPDVPGTSPPPAQGNSTEPTVYRQSPNSRRELCQQQHWNL